MCPSLSEGSFSTAFLVQLAFCGRCQLPMLCRWSSSMGHHCNSGCRCVLHTTSVITALPPSLSPPRAIQWHLCQSVQGQPSLVVLCGSPSSTAHCCSLHTGWRSWKISLGNGSDLLSAHFSPSVCQTVWNANSELCRVSNADVLDGNHTFERTRHHTFPCEGGGCNILHYFLSGVRSLGLGGRQAERLEEKASTDTRICCSCPWRGRWWDNVTRSPLGRRSFGSWSTNNLIELVITFFTQCGSSYTILFLPPMPVNSRINGSFLATAVAYELIFSTMNSSGSHISSTPRFSFFLFSLCNLSRFVKYDTVHAVKFYCSILVKLIKSSCHCKRCLFFESYHYHQKWCFGVFNQTKKKKGSEWVTCRSRTKVRFGSAKVMFCPSVQKIGNRHWSHM